jgi:hypothetical protein
MEPANPANPYPDESTITPDEFSALLDDHEASLGPLVKTGQGDYEHLHYMEPSPDYARDRRVDDRYKWIVYGTIVIMCVCGSFAFFEYLATLKG